MTQVWVSLAVIPDLIALDVGLAANSCHKSEILNRLIKKRQKNLKESAFSLWTVLCNPR